MEMEEHLRAAEIIATMLDNRFNVGGLRFGMGAFIELVPEIGDVLILFLSLYLVWIGLKMKIPSLAVAQMVGNIILITTIGTIPIAGDLVYVLYRANMRNLQILKHYAQQVPVEGKLMPGQSTERDEVQQQPL